MSSEVVVIIVITVELPVVVSSEVVVIVDITVELPVVASSSITYIKHRTEGQTTY